MTTVALTRRPHAAAVPCHLPWASSFPGPRGRGEQASAPRVTSSTGSGRGCARWLRVLGVFGLPSKKTRCLPAWGVPSERNNNWRAIGSQLSLSVVVQYKPRDGGLPLPLMGLSYVGLLDHLRSWQSCGRVGAVACLMMLPVAQFAQTMVTSCIIRRANGPSRPGGPPGGVLGAGSWLH